VTVNPDDDLRAQFDARLGVERMAVPDFRSLIDRAECRADVRQQSRRRSGAWVALSLAAAAVVVLATGLVVHRTRERSSIQALSTWRSPTAGLLRTPGTALLQPRDVFTSVLDGAASMAAQPKGASQ
jgi:hypothetical protein